MDIKESDILGDAVSRHWYYRAKAAAVYRLLADRAPRRVLDVGAGSGYFSRHLLKHSGVTEAWCVDSAYESDWDEQEASKPVHFRKGLAEAPADLVLMMDVLEHVDDDSGLLREYVERVPRGASFLVSVPAFQFLWSGHDEFLGHKRRYDLDQLRATVRAAGLEIGTSCYFFGLVLPIAAVTRVVSRWASSGHVEARSQLRAHHPAVDAALMAACRAELPFMRWNRLAGLTVFCLAVSR